MTNRTRKPMSVAMQSAILRGLSFELTELLALDYKTTGRIAAVRSEIAAAKRGEWLVST
jgi:hypothetical protein